MCIFANEGGPKSKVQENKPILKFKNTKKNMCLERIWKKKFSTPTPNPYSAMNFDSVKINTSLIMMKECVTPGVNARGQSISISIFLRQISCLGGCVTLWCKASFSSDIRFVIRTRVIRLFDDKTLY